MKRSHGPVWDVWLRYMSVTRHLTYGLICVFISWKTYLLSFLRSHAELDYHLSVSEIKGVDLMLFIAMPAYDFHVDTDRRKPGLTTLLEGLVDLHSIPNSPLLYPFCQGSLRGILVSVLWWCGKEGLQHKNKHQKLPFFSLQSSGSFLTNIKDFSSLLWFYRGVFCSS